MATDGSTSSQPRETRAKTHWFLWGVAGLIVLAILAWGLSRAPGGTVTVSGDVVLGGPAPEIILTDFDDETFELSEYEGRPLVVNFWASWCPNCIAEMPAFENVHRATEGEIEFLGINHSDSRAAAMDLARATGVTYRLATDARGEVFRTFGAVGMPATVFIDADGNVVDVVVGQFSEETLVDYIARSFPGHDGG